MASGSSSAAAWHGPSRSSAASLHGSTPPPEKIWEVVENETAHDVAPSSSSSASSDLGPSNRQAALPSSLHILVIDRNVGPVGGPHILCALRILQCGDRGRIPCDSFFCFLGQAGLSTSPFVAVCFSLSCETSDFAYPFTLLSFWQT
jgi:hypothetical protein